MVKVRIQEVYSSLLEESKEELVMLTTGKLTLVHYF